MAEWCYYCGNLCEKPEKGTDMYGETVYVCCNCLIAAGYKIEPCLSCVEVELEESE